MFMKQTTQDRIIICPRFPYLSKHLFTTQLQLRRSPHRFAGGDHTYMLSFLSIGRHPMQMTCSAIKLFSSSCNLAPATIPSQRETHFWYTVPDEVEDPSLLSQYRSLLSPCENQSVLRMHGDKLQKRALLARALVRTTLARYTDSIVSPSLLKFKKNTYGKPEVEWQYDKKWDPPPLHFNLSHTSSLIACGVTVNTPIGVDVEEKQRMTRNNISSLARRYFSSDEVEYLHAIPDPEIRRQEFIKLWTLKEAYVKALGRGFSATPFKTFTIRFGGIRRSNMQTADNSNSEACKIVVDIPHCSKDLTSNWEFAIFELANSHYASICVESNTKVEEDDALKLKVWKTLPFVKDEYLSQTDSVRIISGLT